MKLFSALSAAAVLACVANPANAFVEKIGQVGDKTYLFGAAGSSFSDSFSFSLSGFSDLATKFGSLFADNFSWDLKSGATDFGESKSYTGLGAGSYTFTFSGTPTFASFPVFYGGSFATSVSAVPEADTWLMLLIGAGLVAYQLRRKQKVVRRPLLTA